MSGSTAICVDVASAVNSVCSPVLAGWVKLQNMYMCETVMLVLGL